MGSSSGVQLQQVAQAALAPLGGEVLAPGECGAAEHGLGLGHDHAWAIRVQLSVLGQICSAHTQGPGVTQGSLVLGLPGKPCPRCSPRLAPAHSHLAAFRTTAQVGPSAWATLPRSSVWETPTHLSMLSP